MAGLSQRLTSLVKAAPQLLPYTLFNLGKNLPVNQGPNRGFIARVESLRMQLVQKSLSPLALLTLLEGDQQRLENTLLEIGEKSLLVKLLQSSSLNVFLRQLSTAKPEALKKRIGDKDPLIRFLTINTIARRSIHLERELIERLDDPVRPIRDAAHRALCRVARGTDFGPIPGASQRGIERSVEKWKYWLALQESASSETLAKDRHLELVPLVLVPEERTAPPPEATKKQDRKK